MAKREEKVLFAGKELTFRVAPGVFAHYGIDFGSMLLLQELQLPAAGTFLDLGCGCGILGLSLAAGVPAAKVYLVDSDIRAVRLTRENAKLNGIKNVEVTIGDGVKDLPAGLVYDVVVSNPPTHQGTEVLIEFIEGTYRVLKPGGTAYFVVNRMTSVMRRLEEVSGRCEKLTRKQGYMVLRVVKE